MNEGLATGYFDPTLFDKKKGTCDAFKSAKNSEAWSGIDSLWLTLILMTLVGGGDTEESEL